MLPQTTTATIGNMLPQDLKTIVFRIFRCYFAAWMTDIHVLNDAKQVAYSYAPKQSYKTFDMQDDKTFDMQNAWYVKCNIRMHKCGMTYRQAIEQL